MENMNERRLNERESSRLEPALKCQPNTVNFCLGLPGLSTLSDTLADRM